MCIRDRTWWAALLFRVGATAFGFLVPALSGFIAYAIADRPGPVSYTHLDVYKRQVRDAAYRLVNQGITTCLLYTSRCV